MRGIFGMLTRHVVANFILHKKQIAKIEAEISQAGMSFVPLRVYVKDGFALKSSWVLPKVRKITTSVKRLSERTKS
jgi:tmRNA-binding protein